jgi:dUTPase
MSPPSLADQAVETLAAVSSIDRDVTNDHPERFVIRSMKRIAQDIIANALRQAMDLAYQADSLKTDMRKSEQEKATP